MNTEILKYDPEFTEQGFKTFVDNVFIQIHLAVMTKTLENVKHFMSDEVYNKFESKVADLKSRNVIQMYDEINVKETHLGSSKIENDKIIISVKIISRYMDYVMSEDGTFISGNNTSRIMKNNYLSFEKSINATELGSVRKCPGCGASIDVNANGKCEYCGSIFNLKDKGWILTSIITE